MQGSNSDQGHVLPAGTPCIVQASLGSIAAADILLHSVSLERGSRSDGADAGLLNLSCYFVPCTTGKVLSLSSHALLSAGTARCYHFPLNFALVTFSYFCQHQGYQKKGLLLQKWTCSTAAQQPLMASSCFSEKAMYRQ